MQTVSFLISYCGLFLIHQFLPDEITHSVGWISTNGFIIIQTKACRGKRQTVRIVENEQATCYCLFSALALEWIHPIQRLHLLIKISKPPYVMHTCSYLHQDLSACQHTVLVGESLTQVVEGVHTFPETKPKTSVKAIFLLPCSHREKGCMRKKWLINQEWNWLSFLIDLFIFASQRRKRCVSQNCLISCSVF